MDTQQILIDAASRPIASILEAATTLTYEELNAQPGGHDNSVGWLMWHTGRQIDAQVSSLSGAQQVWEARGYGDRLGITDPSVGYGHSPDEARAIHITDLGALAEYLTEAGEALTGYLSRLTEADLGQVIDPDWDPPVTRGVRLVSIVNDAAMHAGQVGYALGILKTG